MVAETALPIGCRRGNKMASGLPHISHALRAANVFKVSRSTQFQFTRSSVVVLNRDIAVIAAIILEIVRQIGKYTARKTHQKLRFCSQPIPGGLISCASRVNFPSKCCGSTQGLSARPRRQFCYCDTLKREQQSAWLSVHAAQPGNRPCMRSTNKLREFITNLGMERPSSVGQGRNFHSAQ